jgi:hypothetical protein
MKLRFPIAFVLAGLVCAGGFAAAMNARAQQAMQNDAATPSGGMHRHDRGEDYASKFSDADRAAFFDARVAAMHAGLTLTPDQEKLWPPIETAVRDVAKTMKEQRKVWHDEPRPSDPVQMLQRISSGSIARGEALKKLADAMAPLYATLNDDQKRRLPILLAHLRPHPMHFAMMGEHRFGEGGEERGWSHEHHDRDGDRGHDDHDRSEFSDQ